MSEKKFSTIIKYNAPKFFRNRHVIYKIYEIIDSILNHIPQEYTETSIVSDLPSEWTVRVELDEPRSKKLTEGIVDVFVDALENGILEIISNELK